MGEHTTSATGATGLSDGTYRDASTLRYGGEQDTGALGTQSHEDHKDKLPIERTTGMPFDPSKDPAAASRLNEQGDVVSPEQRRRTSSEEFEAINMRIPRSIRRSMACCIRSRIRCRRELVRNGRPRARFRGRVNWTMAGREGERKPMLDVESV